MEAYERVRILGKGSYGQAWLVRHRGTKEMLVMKDMQPRNDTELKEALAEATLLKVLSHPNIVKYREVLRSNKRDVHLVMEYAPGGDLCEFIEKHRIKAQPIPEERIVTFLTQLVSALRETHSKGMMHRDIKPGNIFLGHNGESIKLGDFGIARVLDDNAARMSKRTCLTPIGTPMYMAPELCQGTRYGQKADIWALGCVVYELIALRPAFMAVSMGGLMAKIRGGQFSRTLPPCYSEPLRKLVLCMLSAKPDQRPSTNDLAKHPLLAFAFPDVADNTPLLPSASAAPAAAPAHTAACAGQRLGALRAGSAVPAAARLLGLPAIQEHCAPKAPAMPLRRQSEGEQCAPRPPLLRRQSDGCVAPLPPVTRLPLAPVQALPRIVHGPSKPSAAAAPPPVRRGMQHGSRAQNAPVQPARGAPGLLRVPFGRV